MRRITQIKNLSERRRLPRLGKIRGGVKVPTDSGGFRPKETPWFVVPDEVAKKIGTDQPTELNVLIPVEDTNVSFPQAYELYGSGKGLKCTGDGEIAFRMNEQTKEMEERTCPCEYLEQKKCKQRAHLMVILPDVSMGGVYQLDTSSYNSIVDINSSIEYVRGLVGRVAMVPLKLRREPRETHHDGKKQIHYTMSLVLDATLDQIKSWSESTSRVLSAQQTYSLPAPVQENPEEEDDSGNMAVARNLATAKSIAEAVDKSEPGDVVIVGNDGVVELREELQSMAPAIEYITLLNKIGAATNADEVNQTLDLANKLTVPDHKVAVRKAAAKRMQELIKR